MQAPPAPIRTQGPELDEVVIDMMPQQLGGSIGVVLSKAIFTFEKRSNEVMEWVIVRVERSTNNGSNASNLVEEIKLGDGGGGSLLKLIEEFRRNLPLAIQNSSE